jgi:hypothetical protein
MDNERYGQRNKTKINGFSLCFMTHLLTYHYIKRRKLVCGMDGRVTIAASVKEFSHDSDIQTESKDGYTLVTLSRSVTT